MSLSPSEHPEHTGSPDPHLELPAAHWLLVAKEMSEALLIVTNDGSIRFANQLFADWFGLSIVAVGEDANVSALRERLSHCFANKQVSDEKLRSLTPGHGGDSTGTWEIAQPSRRILELRAVRLPGTSETLLLWRDLTEKRDLQDALHRAQRMESLGRLSGGIAHDINNLLTAISGNLSLALQHVESDNPTEARALLATASKAAIGGREIVKQLLTHARKTIESVESFDLRDLIADVRGLLKHTISPLVLVEFQLPKSLWTVTADRSSIQQVVINLCVNAVDAMKGRVNSRLSLNATNIPRSVKRAGCGRPESDYVRLQVRDNGCGIPPEVLKRIFEPFYTTKAQGEGTGLGLSISREIVEKFGGWIECDSQPGTGTTFSVFLPRGDKVIVEKKPAAVAPAKQSSLASSAERILVVDDDALVRTVSARLLSSVGYKVFTATDGVEALEWLRTAENVADLILLDVSMPRLSGHDTMQKIRQLRPGLPVVMCSGSLSLCDPDAPQEGDPLAPPEGRICKPYDVGELTRTVRQVLDHCPADAAVCVA